MSASTRSARAHRIDTLLSVLLLDLDYFKQVNDCWGHASGDLALRATAHVLQKQLRSDDLATRTGGGKFLALLPASTPAHALQTAERIRRQVARLTVDVPGSVAVFTASIGIDTLQAGESVAALLAGADAVLHRAKAAGRGRCVLAGPAASVPSADDTLA